MMDHKYWMQSAYDIQPTASEGVFKVGVRRQFAKSHILRSPIFNAKIRKNANLKSKAGVTSVPIPQSPRQKCKVQVLSWHRQTQWCKRPLCGLDMTLLIIFFKNCIFNKLENKASTKS